MDILDKLLGEVNESIKKEKSFPRTLLFRNRCKCGHEWDDIQYYMDDGEGKLTPCEPHLDGKMIAYDKKYEFCTVCKGTLRQRLALVVENKTLTDKEIIDRVIAECAELYPKDW